MRRLPTVVAGACRWALPMADASQTLLAELLLGGAEVGSGDPLAAALAADPPLLLWAVCNAAVRDDFVPQSVSDVLHWLARNAAQVLRWDSPSPQSDAPQWSDARHSDALADAVAVALQVGELAAQLARGAETAAIERARLLGLTHNARQWLVLAGDDLAQHAEQCLPAWLSRQQDDRTPAAAAVHLAEQVLAGEASLPAGEFSPEGTTIDVDACRRRAQRGRERWLMSLGGAADWLPVLEAKLRRLGELEKDFFKTVETEKLEAMAEFAAGAGHEINNPLTVISGRAQLFLQQETNPERRRALALISAQAMRVYEMIADMRLFARPPQPERQHVDLVALVDRVIDDFAPRAARQETTIGRRGDAGPLWGDADPTQMTVALGALCQNALEAIGYGGHVEIALRRSGCDLEIAVADDGPGILPEERQHVFDPFYSARQAGRGLGLGLSKCWRIVTNHGGRINVQSQPGHGATFTITLPIGES